MKYRGVHLHYAFQPEGQRGAAVQHPLFDLLSAVHQNGSIQRAAVATGASYRHVWGALKQWEVVIGESLVHWVQGHPARLTPFAERLLLAEGHARARLAPHIESLRAELENVLAEALDGASDALTLHASHDPALSALRDTARTAERLHIDIHSSGSFDALRALVEGHCTVAGFHVPTEGAVSFAAALKPLLKADHLRLIGSMRRIQGLMVAAGNPRGLHSLQEVVTQRAGFTQRQTGSATRLWTGHLLTQAGIEPARLSVVRTDIGDAAAAASVAGGLAEAAIGSEAAARVWGLDFVPLGADDFFLACHADALEEPAVLALRRTLQQEAWQRSVQALPGYSVSRAGEVLSVGDALPWVMSGALSG